MTPRWFDRFRREEDGAVAATAALCMVMFVGCLGLAMDGGQMYIQRTQLQKATDSAALAAAYDLMPGSLTTSDADATLYANYNQVLSSEVLGSPDTGKLTVLDGPCAANGCPAYKVTAKRLQPLAFAPLIGVSQATIKASATAINSPAQKIESEYLLPYAVWDGNGGSLTTGQSVIYRDDGWAGDNVVPDPSNCGGQNQPPCNPNWNVPGGDNSFKGFLHMPADKCGGSGTSQYGQGDTIDSSKGGNSDENVCKTILNGLAATTQAAIMPVIDYGCKDKGCDGGPASNCPSGDVCVHIKGFVGVIPGSVSNMGSAWTGSLTNWTTFHGTPGGHQTSEPAIYVLKLWY